MKKNTILTITALVLAAALAFLLLWPEGQYVPYGEFASMAENGDVEKARISGESVIFSSKDGDKFRTDNPDYDTFRQELLLKGIEVSGGAGNTGALVSDIVFYAVLLAAAFFVYRKYKGTAGSDFRAVRKTGVTFDDIVGLENVKDDMKSLLAVLKNPDAYREKGIRPVKGIIFEGPPGNGKTLFAKALAEEAGVSFIAAKGADFQSALMAVGPAKIRSLFRKAAKNRPCIIFIDEFDGIGEKRNYAGAGIDKENNRLIITLLNEMDGFKANDGVLVIAATNSFASLDPALVRPGRFDRKYTMTNPDKATIEKLIALTLKKSGLSSELELPALAESFKGLSCAAVATLINEAAMEAVSRGKTAVDRECLAEALRRTGIKIAQKA